MKSQRGKMMTRSQLVLDCGPQDVFKKQFDFKAKESLNERSVDGQTQFVPEKVSDYMENLSKLKHDLNRTKSQLKSIDLVAWGEHTSYLDPSGWIVRKVKSSLLTSNSCGGPFVTRGWIKLYEILSIYNFQNLIADVINSTPTQQEIRVLFLCEAPGGFVSAMECFLAAHFQQSEKEVNFDWLATSLNPHHKTHAGNEHAIKDDRFMFRNSETYAHWYFGPDDTGDIFQPEFLEGLQTRALNKKFNIITADGSLNCISSPENQEDLVFPLLEREVSVALECLADGGHFIIKLFTHFEKQTINLIHLLYTAFHRISFYKPTTSKEGNSEVYLVCIGFKESFCYERSKIDEKCDADFLLQLQEAAKKFKDYQEAAISKNLVLYNQRDDPKVEAQLKIRLCRTKQRVWQKYRDLCFLK